MDFTGRTLQRLRGGVICRPGLLGAAGGHLTHDVPDSTFLAKSRGCCQWDVQPLVDLWIYGSSRWGFFLRASFGGKEQRDLHRSAGGFICKAKRRECNQDRHLEETEGGYR